MTPTPPSRRKAAGPSNHFTPLAGRTTPRPAVAGPQGQLPPTGTTQVFPAGERVTADGGSTGERHGPMPRSERR
ncbi:hypothetical protein [Kitasatospora sp. NPDC127116]|uniref:hypothetical protein n=1 Tax=unclassified Kitasatospora TaxID=2633591 RepID=UPI003376714E